MQHNALVTVFVILLSRENVLITFISLFLAGEKWDAGLYSASFVYLQIAISTIWAKVMDTYQ